MPKVHFRWRGFISKDVDIDHQILSNFIISEIRSYILKCENISLNWRYINAFHYIGPMNRDDRVKFLVFNDISGNVVWIKAITSTDLNIKVNSNEVISLQLMTAYLNKDWKSKLNRKLSMIFQEINFGRRIPYSNTSTHMVSFKSLRHQLNRFNITIDQPDWDALLIENLKNCGPKKYCGFIKAFDAANELYNIYLRSHGKNLEVRYALFIRLYQESKASNSWSYTSMGRRRQYNEMSLVDKIAQWNSHRRLNWATTTRHLNNFWNYMGYKGKFLIESFDWVPNIPNTDNPLESDRNLLQLLNQFYNKGKSTFVHFTITLDNLEFIVRRFFNNWYKSESKSGTLQLSLYKLAALIDNFEFSNCHVII